MEQGNTRDINSGDYLEIAEAYRDGLLKSLGVVGYQNGTSPQKLDNSIRRVPVEAASARCLRAIDSKRVLTDVTEYDGDGIPAADEPQYITIPEFEPPAEVVNGGEPDE